MAFSSSSILCSSFADPWGPLLDGHGFKEAFSYKQSHCYLVCVAEVVASLEAQLRALQRGEGTSCRAVEPKDTGELGNLCDCPLLYELSGKLPTVSFVQRKTSLPLGGFRLPLPAQLGIVV